MSISLVHIALALGSAGFGMGLTAFIRSSLQAKILNDIKNDIIDAAKAEEAKVVDAVKKVF